MLDVILEAVAAVFRWEVLLIILGAAAYGIFVGSIPGLTATMAVALMVPLTLFLEPVEAVAAIVTTVTCSIFAGDIPSTLVRIPGTPASAAYAEDAYALTRQNRYQEALSISLLFSVLGGLFGTVVLIVAAPLLASLATMFTSYEYFWLYVVGLTSAAVVSNQSTARAAIALGLGLLLSTIGLGTDYSAPRLTLGFDELITGVNFIPAMIGLFGLSEVLRNVLVWRGAAGDVPAVNRGEGDRGTFAALGKAVALLRKRPVNLGISSAIGSLVGMLPGAGADIAAWISYAVSKVGSKSPAEYGKGSTSGLSDATGANNAALGSAWIPALVFGIPGDSVTAIAIGVLLMKNIKPGPEIFDFSGDNAQQGVLVVSIYVTFLVANFLLIPLGLLAIRLSSLLIAVPRRVLLPAVLLFCIVGSYAMNASYFDVAVMLAMGVLGFGLERFRIPLGPVVLGIILGGPLEHRFVQCMTKEASLIAFLQSPISILLACFVAALWLLPLALRWLRRGDASGEDASGEDASGS